MKIKLNSKGAKTLVIDCGVLGEPSFQYHSFPKELWQKVRTASVLERDFREVRRRTRPMGFFPTDDSAGESFME